MSKSPPSLTGLRAADRRIAVVVSRYNAAVTDRLLDGARAAFLAAGGRPDRLTVVEAPGSWELPILTRAAAHSRRFDAVAALGCVIKGETSHDQHLARAVCDGLMRVSIDSGVPVTLGVLTVDTEKQAMARAGGAEGNKGAEALEAALATLGAIDALSRAFAAAGPGARVGD